MDPRTASALTLGWQLVAAILARLAVLAGRAWLPGPLWFRVFAELRRAEAAARRLLVVMAAELAMDARVPVPAQGRAVAKALRSPAGPSGFALFDPLPEPGFRMQQDAPEQAADEPVFHMTDGLAARMAALAALAGDPAPAARRMAAHKCEEELQRLEADLDWASRVRARLMQAEGMLPSLDQLAASFHLTSRTLRRYLAAVGVSYRHLLEEVRMARAVRYLQANLPVQKVADLLGYADPSNFTRAFRRWTGHPPSFYQNG